MTTTDQSEAEAAPAGADETHGQPESPVAWLIRAGRESQVSDYNLEHGLARLSYSGYGLPDLRSFSNPGDLVEAMRLAASETPDGTLAKPKTIDEQARQLWMFRTKVRVGHLVVMPRIADHVAVGEVEGEYWYDEDGPDWPHCVSVAWKPRMVPHADLKDDLLSSIKAPGTIHPIRSTDAPWRLQQVMETGRDPGARAGDATGPEAGDPDLSTLVKQFLGETGYPTDAHKEQERLREEWARKLAPENVSDLSPKDLLAYTSNAVEYGQYVTLKEGLQQQWIDDLDPAGYNRLLVSIHDLCWSEDELPTRIDRLVDSVGGFNRDTGTMGFTGLQVSRTLAICHPEQFLPLPSQIGKWGREVVLQALGLPSVRGSYGQRVVDANNRLRQHLAPYFKKDTVGMVAFINWFKGQSNGDLDPGLSDLVERFRAESGYRTEVHDEQERLRAEWAKKLAPENLANLSRHDLTGVASHGTWGAGRYVYPHARGVMRWIRNLDDVQYSRMLDHIRYLCWDEEDELWRRYDQLTDSRSERNTKGLKHSTTSLLLAICHPEDFLPIGQQGGKWGRGAMLHRLGLPKPTGSSLGQRVVDANDRLREHLEPYFEDDMLGMGAFLEWLLEQQPPNGPVGPNEDPVDPTQLAEKLLVDVEFLKDIVSLLQDKGQVILYGPPGTGKTFLARELAKLLAPDESCRRLVQFHPSTSYEDFFEGYRPAGTGDDGNVRYELTHGPLALLAERASEADDQRHVMIIDEINRGNLPRVLGELLFLLEYRDESVQTLYRPDEPFSLPENLWFIGTMNTADRSIALVDAALRRRFHFVPFFPDSGPMAGLLSRWLERWDEPVWVGRLVDAVNNELKEVLEGSHLLLGPSHFMRKYGSSLDTQRERLRRIWEYNIEPFIEDQFFGDPEQINRFRFDSIVSRHRAIIERDRLSIPAGGEELDQGAGAFGSSEAQSSLERSRARGATTPAWKDQFQGTPAAPTDHDELWKWRASNFPRRIEGRGEFQINEIRSLACRWVEFALSAGVDPGRHDSQLVEDLLSPHGYSQGSLTAYRRHLREWFETDHDSAG